MAAGGSLWYNVVASQESTDLASNNGPGCLSPLDGYSELINNTGLGTIPCGTELWLRANGKTIQGRKVDSGGGSPGFNPQIGLYPRVSLALFGTANGGEFHLQIQRVDGRPLNVAGGGNPTTGPAGGPTTLSAGGTAGAGGTGTLTNDLFGAGVLTANFQVGNATNPDEDYWTAMNRIAQERYWMLFSDGETLYLADGPDLMRQKPVLNLDRVVDAGSINHLEFTFDNTAWNYVATHKKRNRVSRRTALAKVTSPVQGQLHAVCAIDEVRAGDTVAFSNCGPGDGRWLVGDCRRSVFEISSEINVVYALTPLTETQLAPPVTGTNAANKGTTPVSISSGTVGRMLQAAKAALGGPYSQAQHATAFDQPGSWLQQNGTDCSGFISYLMGPRGLGTWHQSYTTDTLATAPGISPGSGTQVTIWNNPAPGNAGHVWIDIGGQFFESAGSTGIHQMPASEVTYYKATGQYVPWHPNGL